MADTGILTKVKAALGITGEYQDGTLNEYIENVKEFMKNSGVKEAVVNSDVSAGAISRGVIDMWNLSGGSGEFSQMFLMQVTQLAYKKEVEDNA